MGIEHYIADLLSRHNCVIVPGLGGFVANAQAASINPGKHIFYAPSKALAFNKNLVTNDGLLANEISIEKHITYTEALAAITAYATKLSSKLASGEKVVIQGIGTLQKGFEGGILFSQDTNTNYNLHSFGLGEFQQLPVAFSQKQVATKQLVAPNKTAKPLIWATTKNYMRTAAVAAAVVLAMFTGIGLGNIASGDGVQVASMGLNFNSTVKATKWKAFQSTYPIRYKTTLNNNSKSTNEEVSITTFNGGINNKPDNNCANPQ